MTYSPWVILQRLRLEMLVSKPKSMLKIKYTKFKPQSTYRNLDDAKVWNDFGYETKKAPLYQFMADSVLGVHATTSALVSSQHHIMDS